MDAYISFFDQFRYITGLVYVLVLLCHNVLPHRSRYILRLSLCYAVVLALALCYVPLEYALNLRGMLRPAFVLPYWIVTNIFPVALILICYETNLAGALFRTLMGAITENFATVLVRYIVVYCLFPDLPDSYPMGYLLVLIVTYTIVYGCAYLFWRGRILTDEGPLYQTPKKTAWIYLAVYVSYFVILSATKTAFEYIIRPLQFAAEYVPVYLFLKYFLIADMLLISIVLGLILVNAYNMLTLQNEKQIVTRMVRDRQAQYEFSRENIEMINQKAHDLKHQLLALEQISDEKRRQQLREARKAVDFYDAVVKTGNEALDTLLTEKSVYCQNRDIRLSCTVISERLDRIDVVDLYTLLGNAIDNAIEGVDKLSDPDKKTISFIVRDQGEMLFFHIMNYYEGDIRLEDGLPRSTKGDDWNHGYGTKSIRAIAERYGGNVMIQTKEQVFSLIILIPT